MADRNEVTDSDMQDGVVLRPMTAADRDGILAFARAVPLNDLLFLQRDIRHPKVVAAWIRQTESEGVRSLLAVRGDSIVGCAAVLGDPLSWSPHVAEIRLLVVPEDRSRGVGRRLAQEALAQAARDNMEKVFVRLVPDQAGAIALFEEMGFRPEAMLRDHVVDAEGSKHDLAIFSLDVGRHNSQMRAFGMAG